MFVTLGGLSLVGNFEVNIMKVGGATWAFSAKSAGGLRHRKSSGNVDRFGRRQNSTGTTFSQ